MDRDLIDDIYCFSLIQKEHCLFEMIRINEKISFYENKIKAYTLKKDTLLDHNIAETLDYGIEKNKDRIIWAQKIYNDLVKHLENIDNFLQQYYTKNDYLSISYVSEKLVDHKEIINNINLA